jgi:adenylate cyclase
MTANVNYPTPEKSLQTRRLTEAGLKTDPDNAKLLGQLASSLTSDILNSWNGAGRPEADRAEVAARRAISLDHNTPKAHYAMGYVYRLHGDHQAAIGAFNEAVKIDPSYTKAYVQAANEMVFLGRPRDAIPMVEDALQRSPNDTSIGVFHWVKGRACFVLADYPKAREALGESVRVRPNLWFSHAWLVAAYALTNQDAQASDARDAFDANFGPDHDLDRITRYYQEAQYQNVTLQLASAEVLKGLRRAGMTSRRDAPVQALQRGRAVSNVLSEISRSI